MEKSKKKGPTRGPRTSKLIAPTWQRSRLRCGPLDALRQGCDMRPEALIKTKNADGPIVRAVLVGAWRSPVSAPVWGTGGRGFKSRRPDQQNQALLELGQNREISQGNNRGNRGQGTAANSNAVWYPALSSQTHPE